MSKPISSKKTSHPAAERARAATGSRHVPPTVSARWILAAMASVLAAASLCVWGALCLTFWQGSWQLLYHPAAAVTRTPANVGLAFDSVDFAATEAGQPQLHGWWIPSASASTHLTAIYLHGADGNIGDTVDALIPLHNAGLNFFDFDYRGYGESQFIHPSERRWREDAESAIEYLRDTRHIPASSLILVGKGLGANLALEVAAAHPEVAGVVLDEPLEMPMDAIYKDSRARLVPAHMLVHDRWDTFGSAANLRIPSLWFIRTLPPGQLSVPDNQTAFEKVSAPKMLVWLTESSRSEKDIEDSLERWLDDLRIDRSPRRTQVFLK
jgi:pimeloyl-ACP methyl ester carboxylesterase